MDWINYANQGATRNQPIAPKLAQALGFLPEMGVTMDVFSGGQPAQGSGGARVGSSRHDDGNSADVFFSQNGRRLDWSNPNDVPVFQSIVQRARANGVTGFGAGDGYMQPGSMHIGFGSPAVWGAGGRGTNAPEWLRAAYTSNNGGQEIADQTMAAIGRRPINSDVQPRGILSSKGDQMDQQQPQGLLSALGIQRRDPTAQGETAQPFYNRKSFGDTLSRIAPALGRMGVMGLEVPAQAALDERNARQSDERTMAKMEQQRNATADWLRSQGADELANGVMSGALTGAQALSNMQDSAGSADTVQSSVPLDDGTTVLIMRNGTRRVLAPNGDELTGQAAADAIRSAREYTVQNQTAIYEGRRTGTNTAETNTGQDAAAAGARGSVLGANEAENQITLQTMQRDMPGLMTTVARLDELSGRASFGKAAVLADDTRRALGQEVSPGGVARAEYIATVDNEVLPLLRQTFGAAFTVEEGARLRATLGNEDGTPAERRATLSAFIQQKQAQLEALGGYMPPPVSGSQIQGGGGSTAGVVPQVDLDYLGVGN